MPSTEKDKATKKQPLGRFGSVRDIADATVYLFSDAGSYVNGQTLVGKYCPHFFILYLDNLWKGMTETDKSIFFGNSRRRILAY